MLKILNISHPGIDKRMFWSIIIKKESPCSSVRIEQRFPKPRVARSSRARGIFWEYKCVLLSFLLLSFFSINFICDWKRVCVWFISFSEIKLNNSLISYSFLYFCLLPYNYIFFGEVYFWGIAIALLCQVKIYTK